MTLRLLQGQDLEGGQGGGARLRGDHAAEPRHRPRPDVVVIRTDWGEGTEWLSAALRAIASRLYAHSNLFHFDLF